MFDKYNSYTPGYGICTGLALIGTLLTPVAVVGYLTLRKKNELQVEKQGADNDAYCMPIQ